MFVVCYGITFALDWLAWFVFVLVVAVVLVLGLGCLLRVVLLLCVVTCGDFGGSLCFVWIAFVIAFGDCVGLSGLLLLLVW